MTETDSTLRARTLALAMAVGLLLCAQGCKPIEVTITGSIPEFGDRDTVFVTLTNTWEGITAPPKRFEIDATGRFVLEFTVRVLRPPVTFVMNNSLFARLKFHNLRDVSPIVFDEVRNRSYDLRLKGGSEATAEIEF